MNKFIPVILAVNTNNKKRNKSNPVILAVNKK